MDHLILNTRASRVSLLELTCLPAELKVDEASGGTIVTPSRTACTEAQAAAIRAHRPSMKLFEAKVLKWDEVKTEAEAEVRPEAEAESPKPEVKTEAKPQQHPQHGRR